MRVSGRIILAALLTAAAFSQTVGQPAFEAADVHRSSKTGRLVAQGPFTGGGRYTLRTATLVEMIMKAYGIDDENKIIGGPNWLAYNRFDILARLAPGTTPDSAKLMLQSLLANRFKLVVRKEDQAMPAFNLAVGKGKPKLREAAGSGDTGCKSAIQGLPAANAGGDGAATLNISSLTVSYTCRNMTMEAFTELVHNLANEIVGNAPVYDKTELKGAWDFEFKMSLNIRLLNAGPSSDTITFADALDKQLGLRLEGIKVPQPVILVESVGDAPTPNVSDIARLLPPAPTEFDVAVIKPSEPQAAGPIRLGIQFQPGGRLNLTGLPLKTLMLQAWGINNDMLVGAPKFTETDRYDIVAKAPPDSVPMGPGRGGAAEAVVGVPMDTETVYAMLRKLLEERFKITYHFEDRPASAYDLVAVKPKIKKSDPASRTKWMEGVPAGVKDPRNGSSALGRLITVQNMTMAQFGNELQYIANGYLHSAVLDKTGLEGGYDFTLAFSGVGVVRNGGRGGGTITIVGPNGQVTASLNGAGGDGGDASDPNGAVSLFDAMEKQLGLKLVETKRPVQVMVIDHIEEKPVEN